MSLPVYQNTIVNDRGDVLPEALLRVRTDPGQGNVTLYKDRDGFDVLTNVGDVYADIDGFVRFYLPPGVYRLHVISSGYERTYRHVQVAPLNEYNVVSAEQYTLAITDAGNSIQCISDNPVTIEIPTDEDVEFPMWSETTLIQAGDGIITLSGDVTIQNPSGGPVKSMGKGSSIHLTLIGGNVWLARVAFDRIIDGDIEQTGDFKRTGELWQTGDAFIDNVHISGSTVSASDGGLDISGSFVRVTDRLIAADELWAQGGIDVTGGAAVSEDLSIGGDTVLHGNLHVKGTATIIDSTEVDIGDNIIRLNAGETGQPTLSAGFEIERGLQANVSFLWDEFSKRWTTGTQKLHSAGFIGDGSEITNVAWGNVSGQPDAYPPSAHQHPASQISDSTTVGRAVITASDAAAARAAIGAAAQGGGGDITSEQITDSTPVGRAVLTAPTKAAARAAMGAAAGPAGRIVIDSDTVLSEGHVGRNIILANNAILYLPAPDSAWVGASTNIWTGPGGGRIYPYSEVDLYWAKGGAEEQAPLNVAAASAVTLLIADVTYYTVAGTGISTI